MTRILLLGASGRTGKLILTEALSRSYTVTAIVRRPDSLTAQDNVTIIAGTPENGSDVAKAFDSAPASDPIRAVVGALNNGRTSDFPWAKTTAPPNLMETSARNCVSAMKEHGCEKIIWLGTNGVGDSRKQAPFFFNWIVDHSNFKITFDDHYATQQLFEAEAEKDSAFKWVDVRAGGLTNGVKREIKYYGNDGKGYPLLGMISRASVAVLMVDCVESDKWDGQTPVVSN